MENVKLSSLTSKECEALLVDIIKDQIEALANQMRCKSKSELKRQVLKQEQSYLVKPERVGLIHLTLGQVIYKERFKREIILRGEKR